MRASLVPTSRPVGPLTQASFVLPVPLGESGTTLPNLGHVSRDVVIPSETRSGEWEQLARTRLVAVVPRGGNY